MQACAQVLEDAGPLAEALQAAATRSHDHQRLAERERDGSGTYYHLQIMADTFFRDDTFSSAPAGKRCSDYGTLKQARRSY